MVYKSTDAYAAGRGNSTLREWQVPSGFFNLKRTLCHVGNL
jgi:hypothetical protein